MFRSHLTILLTVAFLSLPLATAQDSDQFDEPFSKKEADQAVKLADEALANAERAQRRGDAPGMERALENYSRHINKLERTIHGGNVLQDNHGDVADMVFAATDKHISVLENLEGKVSEKGWDNGIYKHALAASTKGRDTAFANLTKERREELTQKHERQRGPGSRTSQSDDSLHGSRPSTGPGTAHGPGTAGGPSRGGSQRGQGRGR